MAIRIIVIIQITVLAINTDFIIRNYFQKLQIISWAENLARFNNCIDSGLQLDQFVYLYSLVSQIN